MLPAAAMLSGARRACPADNIPRVDLTSPVSTAIAGAGRVTLTEWDLNTDGGLVDAQTRLNAEFQKRYPNVTVNRVIRSFSDLKTTAVGAVIRQPT